MKMRVLKPVWVAAAGALLAGGCTVHEVSYENPPVVSAETTVGGEVLVTEAPPVPMVEEMTISPGPAFIWIQGAWVWRGHWDWERGHWDRRPRPGAVWVPHRYMERDGRRVFIRGGWR